MEKLHVSMIIEILGRPPEHIKEALNTIVVKLGSEKGVKILSKKYHDPIPVENTRDLFTAFAEIDTEMDSLYNYFGIIFAYMPANIEIIKPETISLSNVDFTDLGNKLLQRLHEYDALTKNVAVERDMFLKKLQEIAPHLFQQAPPQQQTPASTAPAFKSAKPSKKSANKKRR